MKLREGKVTHVIFDLDGTLLDTETAYRKGYRQVCSRHGVLDRLTPNLEATLAGQSAMQVAHTMKNECGMNISADALRSELDLEIQPILSGVKLKPGAEKLITHLSKNKVPLALASSSRRKNAKIKMRSYGSLFSSFSHMVFRDDEGISAGKPCPDVFIKAVDEFQTNVEAERVLVFEDSVNGVEAAKKAGMKVVMVPDTAAVDKSVDIIQSLDDFRPEQYGLPPFAEEVHTIHSPQI